MNCLTVNSYLWQKDNISSSALAKQTGLALNTLTRMIENLERKGLVVRQADPKDKRIKLICLTDKGRNLEATTIATNEQMTQIFYKDFTDDEIIAFEKMLEKIVNNLMEG